MTLQTETTRINLHRWKLLIQGVENEMLDPSKLISKDPLAAGRCIISSQILWKKNFIRDIFI